MREEEIGLRYALRVFLEDGEKKISVIILKSALRDLNLLTLTFLTFPCHFRHIFVAKLFIIVMRNLEALSEGFYLHNMYRYLEINKLY